MEQSATRGFKWDHALVGSRKAPYLLPEFDKHLVEKKFVEFKVNPPEVGEVESQFYVPPHNGHAVALSSILFSQETISIPLTVVAD